MMRGASTCCAAAPIDASQVHQRLPLLICTNTTEMELSYTAMEEPQNLLVAHLDGLQLHHSR